MPNRLAHSKSLYLRKHANNPINWWFWGEEALATAKAENKPIFLSIGYSSCHWCTVMEGEAFSDRAIADYINENFLPIKVDREERPDLDSLYMQTLQMMTGQGGWPLNVFLSPEDLVPFYGGTYFPAEPRYNRPGFLQVLQTLRRFYDEDKEKLQQVKDTILTTLNTSKNLSQDAFDLSEEVLRRGAMVATQIIGEKEFGRPSFPMMPYSLLVLHSSPLEIKAAAQEARSVAIQRGDDLALGGICDHVAGGFHRYTVDAAWTVPHFEKMLYDNGQILGFLVDLWSTGENEPAYDRAIAGIVDWLKREMTAPEGYFYAAQDADNFVRPTDAEPKEGAFYVWRYNDIKPLLTDLEFKGLRESFVLSLEGNFEGKNVLKRSVKGKFAKKLENALSKLFKVRYGESRETLKTVTPAQNSEEAKTLNWKGRIPPVTDTKAIVAWNGLTISGLAKAYTVFQKPTYWQLAAQAATFILQNQWKNGRLHRLNYQGTVSIPAQSEDYAFLIKALLDLQQASLISPDSQTNWLEEAQKVQQEFDEWLWNEEMGGYDNTAKDASDDLLIRERSYIDSAIPSANGIAIANLLRLSLLTDNLEYRDRAERGLKAFSRVMEESPQACPSLFLALHWYRNATVVRTTVERLPTLMSQFFPVAVYQIAKSLPSGAIGIVCRGTSCLEPAQSEARLLDQMQPLDAPAPPMTV
ncbi:thioredoxin domain-containing protein [Lusitaniella coriacea LEGE 07157]|uniref:Thioredoxin domain-containing protein n=1 Tax=Lusitaniella coriacea LEGE 07157 TaxID=945747 RepID=A0A8J7DLJ7_9CYAN|nr:thioredoxin domain-containing protein [Lusitaniella coriacea]MBE9115223.1 thioredoxin domain-containing protein [Lusitaniella coriacea LEGE 07157]